MSCCIKCGKKLSGNEIGLHKKLFNRGATEFMCIDCCAEYFDVDRSRLEEAIERYKNMGCTLFS